MEPIAIIGFAFRLPGGAEDVNGLWELLESGRNVMRKWPKSRTNVDAFTSEYTRQENVLNCNGAHFLGRDDVDEEETDSQVHAFDAPFFSIMSKEAAALDPQQRLLLETTYRAIENAGIPLSAIAGSQTGVYSGSMTEDYVKVITKDADHAPKTASTSVSLAMLANRLSWYFDLRGPSMMINTACSSGMIALDLACQSLRSNQSGPLAIVTGSNLLLTPELSLHLTSMNFLSPDSVCHSFDHRANGYGRGEGIVVLVLKRLSEAVRDGDVIRAVIRATGSNQDGHTPGITQPSLTAQEELIRGLYKRAGLNPEATRYVEAHGTGTPLGDATEANCLGRIFTSTSSTKGSSNSNAVAKADSTAGTNTEPQLYIGSIKAAIGHTEGASGLAGIVKSILILERGIIPPNPLFQKWNSGVNSRFRSKLAVPTKCTPWPGGSDGLRRISVNSFGFGGSNSHAILDDAFHALQEFGLRGKHNTNFRHQQLLEGSTLTLVRPSTSPEGQQPEKEASSTSSVPKLLIWSAPDEAGLRRTLRSFSEYLQKSHSDGTASDDFVDELAYNLAARRSVMTWRSFALLSSNTLNEVAGTLFSCPLIRSSPSAPGESDTSVTFVFTGQGAQYAGMGLELANYYSVFRRSLDQADSEFKALAANFGDETWPSLQPLCTALQLALVDLMTETFSIVPGAVVGHSSGEIAAAYTAGALSFSAACKVAYHRGRLTGRLVAEASTTEAGDRPESGMMSVNLSEAQAQRYLDSDAKEHGHGGGLVHIACVNSPSNVTLSGESAALLRLEAKLSAEGVFTKRLNTPIGYHSPSMQPIAGEYLASMGETLEPGVGGRTIMISSVTGEKTYQHALSKPQYWVDNLISPVRFANALEYIVLAAPRVDSLPAGCVSNFIEIGPHAALRRPALDTVSPITAGKKIEYLSTLSRFEGMTAVRTVMEMIGRLFALGQCPVETVLAANQPTTPEKGKKSDNIPQSALADLPEYPFDHSPSQVHHFESRLSRDWRLREGKASSLLGIPIMEGNPLQPTWRKILSIEELPWMAQHVVSGVIYFPGAGSLIMALEAVQRWYRQQAAKAQGNTTIKGWEVKEATFLNPIVLREGGTTEVLTHLRPAPKSSERADVQIFALVDGYWAECFRATIAVQPHDGVETTTPIDGGREDKDISRQLRQKFEEAKSGCSQQVSKRNFYDWQARHGLEYGPIFARLEEIAWDGGIKSAGQISHLSSANSEEKEAVLFSRSSGVLVHPAVLDAAFQLCSTPPSQGMSKNLKTTSIPSKMRKVWISATGWQGGDDAKIRVWVESKSKVGGRGVDCSLAMFSHDGTPLCNMSHLQILPTASGSAGDSTTVEDKATTGGLVNSIAWKPHLSLLSSAQLQEYCSSTQDKEGLSSPAPKKSDSANTPHERLGQTILAALQQVIPQIRDMPSQNLPHISKYLTWAETELGDANMTSDGAASEISQKLDTLEKANPEFGYPISIARNLLSILRGDLDAGDLFRLSLSSLPIGCRKGDMNSPVWSTELASFLGLWVHSAPNPQRIISLGGGTDHLASHIISSLRQIEDSTGWMAFSEFVITDPSPVFLEHARTQSEQWPEYLRERARFDVLDISISDNQIKKDSPESRGEYQLVLLSASILAAGNVDRVLKNARQLLKANGGYLVIYDQDSTLDPSSRLITSFSYGVLSDWWDSRRGGQQERLCLSMSGDNAQLVDGLLRKTGYSGLEMTTKTPGQYRIAVSSALGPSAKQGEPASSTEAVQNDQPQAGVKPLFICGDGDTESADLAHNLASSLNPAKEESPLNVLPLTQLLAENAPAISSTDVVIFLADISGSFLSGLSGSTFYAMREMFRKAKNILWVTGRNPVCPPSAGLGDGLLRALRAEYADKRIISLSLAEVDLNQQQTAEYVARVFAAVFLAEGEDVEYVVRENGLLQVGRVVEERALDDHLTAGRDNEATTIKTEPWLPGPPLALTVETPGSLESVRLSDDRETFSKPLGPNQIEIEAKMWGVTFRDVFIALGQLPEEVDDFGLDCAGVVTRLGDAYSGDIRPGDRVLAYRTGCMRMWPRIDESGVTKIPDSMTFADACATMGPAVTAWHSLVNAARLTSNDKVLIHSAAGATGQLAVQIAQSIGAEIFVTVGHEDKKQLILDTYGGENGIQEDHILYSRDLSFAKGIKRLTNGYGVDVVLNSVAGDGLQASWECLAPYGRFAEIGKVDIRGNSPLPMAQFAKNVSFSAIDLRHIAMTRPELLRDIIKNVVQLANDGKIRNPAPVRTYKISQVEDAFRYLQSGKNVGRILIEIDRDEPVQKYISPSHKSWRFDADAAYVVVGGLGGIGMTILEWMAEKGAKHIVVPLRSGGSSNFKATKLVKEMAGKGVNISTPGFDVSNAEDMGRLVEESGRPIKGCINAAMVLNDSIFDNMTHEQWESTLNSKVQTSWNLHQLLPLQMDFFILLSSVSGIIGNPGQSNYTAGCTFQDHLAAWRRGQGLKATSIDLGVVRQVGVVAENEEFHGKLTSNLRGLREIDPEDILGTLEIFCDPENDSPKSQVILGLVGNAPQASESTDYDKSAGFLHLPMFRHLSSLAKKHDSSEGGKTQSNQALFEAATTKEERVGVIRQALAKKLARALSIKAEDIDTRLPLHAFGIDSLVAVEIRNWFIEEFSADLAIFELMGGGRSVEAVCELAVERVKK
ncbi:polyketide synthase [Rhypophila sp. PSN 637]